MALSIRLSRHGRIHRPFFRIVAIDKRCHREGKTNEILGTYDPLLKEKGFQADIERITAWVKQGAEVSEAVSTLLKHNGYPALKAPVANKAPKAKAAAKKAAPAKGTKQAFSPASRRAKLKHQAKLKAARKIETEKAVAAAKAEKAAKAEAPAAQA
jgi:small subunit ribosomal protein S16